MGGLILSTDEEGDWEDGVDKRDRGDKRGTGDRRVKGDKGER